MPAPPLRRDPLRRARSLLGMLVLTAGVAACGGQAAPAATMGTGGGAPTTSGGPVSSAPAEERTPLSSVPPADPASVAAVAELIAATSLEDEASLGALDGRRFDDVAAEAAATALAAGVAGDARWAAAWVYASSGTDAAVLQPLLADEDPSIRALAAAALVSWGDASAIPALVSLAAEPGLLAGSVPPATVGNFATGTLARFVDPAAAAGATSPADAAAAWEVWLAAHEGSLVFDPATGTWSPR